MNKSLAIPGVLFAALAVLGASVPPALTWMGLREAEKGGDISFKTMVRDQPVEILGGTRAVYLEGYGVVFSAELDLVPSIVPNPFRPSFTKQEIASARELKKARIATLRDHMRSMMMTYAKSIEIPMDQNVALAVTIPNSRVENAEGLPKQIVMSAPRGALRSGNGEIIKASLKVQELY